ncbi:hypothetical protein BaRGS_00006991 [Batillaria attramentaria]|uniref:Myotubularin phosphatase domain-containing protein n=1 Tax=Batillaria attramentaria TaxID=370345 RepID=A0ABD0LPT5_9CAEN
MELIREIDRGCGVQKLIQLWPSAKYASVDIFLEYFQSGLCANGRGADSAPPRNTLKGTTLAAILNGSVPSDHRSTSVSSPWAEQQIEPAPVMAKRFISYLNNYEVEMKEKGKATFVSYISDLNGDEEEEAKEEEDEEVEKSASAFFDDLMQPSLLPGETIITHAESALRFAPCSDRKQGISGNLFVTNFKVSFVTADKSSYTHDEKKQQQRNKLIDDTDIPLTSIDTIYQVLSGGKRKSCTPGSIVSSSSKYLEIHCKDFRIHVFGFKFVPKEQNKRVTQAILHHSCPTRDDLLFAYEFALHGKFREKPMHSRFYNQQDWELELGRLKCQEEWRVADVNKLYNMSTSLPEYFVVPNNITNADLQKASGQYNEKRLPTWSYSYSNGACLVRMSQLNPDSDFKKCEENMLAAVKLASGETGEVKVVDLAVTCPTIADIQASGQRLMALCMIDSVKDFYSQDSTWMSRLDATQWLQNVASILKTAEDIKDTMLSQKRSVALKEETGYDVSCVVSCLVQMILDPVYRTQQGFSSLIQREWVVMGHPFQTRSRLVLGEEGQQSPVFLLFLDCVWQLLQQFPSRFEFTETFLTTLWDTLQLGLTETFLFNSAWHRQRFFREGRKLAIVSLPSVWEWRLQFSEEDILLFNNPLYSLNATLDLETVIASAKGSLKRSGSNTMANSYPHTLAEFYERNDKHSGLFKKPTSNVLHPVYSSTAMLQLWSQCYLRWSVPAQILGGGRPAQYLQQCLLVEEVVCLHHRVKILEEQKDREKRDRSNLSLPRPQSGLVFSLESHSVLDSGHLTSSFPFPAAVTAQTQHKLISGPLSLYLHDSLLQYDYTDAED